MTKRIFRAIFGSSLLILLISILLLGVFIDRELEKKIHNNLQDETRVVVEFLKRNTLEMLKGNFLQNRIRILSPDKEVLFDNIISLKDELKYSTEKAPQKIFNDLAMQRCYEENLTTKVLKITTILPDGKILEVSNCKTYFFGIIFSDSLILFALFLFIFICSFFLASYLSKIIILPLNNIDLKNPYNSKIYDEFLPFLSKISQQETLIHKQIAQLKQKQEDFNAITQNMQEAFLIIDDQYRILSFNKSASRLFGAIYLGDNIFGISRQKELKEAIEKALQGKNSEEILEKDSCFYQVFASSVYEDKKIIGAVILILDITEIKERENLRREFSANVSHELKTPLTSILGYADLIKNNLVPQKDMQQIGTKIHQQSQHLLELINDIIKISRLDEGQSPYQKEEFNLRESIENILQHINTKDITIKLFGECKIFGVKTLIEDMIFNLCDNAVKYNKKNGKIFITLEESQSGGSFSIQDTGMGISIQNQQRVFERFFREDKSRSKTIEGTGLGLSIVKHIAILHSFDLNLQSELGVGTTITVSWNKK
ncbi:MULTISPECIES: sensor histidine kinase [unclassified Helicobacter]|uniref:sensor histidine kinase n=1 Tax=unclassified Helicobacter TaxID=2593540 RepID=UPI000CF0C4DC|nr:MULTISPECIES: ATP-binding protein [unclassified Helicobacter]